MSAALDYGVQSFCFRNFKDNADVAQKVLEIGVKSIEICGVHADFHDLEGWKDVVKTYQDAGVAVVSIGVNTFTGDTAERDFFECVKIAGADHISCHFQVDTYAKAMPMVRQWCQEYGVKVGIHCHGGYSFGGQPDVLRHLIGLGQPEVGLCIDTAWAMQIGPRPGDPVQWAKNFAGHVHSVHYKDFVFGQDGMWEDVVVGRGNLDLKGFVAALEEGGFDGMAVIEYEADPENPVPALKECVENMRATVG